MNSESKNRKSKTTSPSERGKIRNSSFRRLGTAFGNGGLWIRAFVSLGLVAIVVATILWVFRSESHSLTAILINLGEGDRPFAFQNRLGRRDPLDGLLVFLTLAVLTRVRLEFESIFGAFSNGSESEIEWSDYSGCFSWDWISSQFFAGLQYLLIAITAAVPLFAASRFFGCSARISGVSLGLGLLIFFPIVFLSTLDSDSFYSPLTKTVVRSLAADGRVWLTFYAITVLPATLIFVLLATISNSIAFWSGFVVLIGCGPQFYAIFLGRLAWILQNAVRARADD